MSQFRKLSPSVLGPMFLLCGSFSANLYSQTFTTFDVPGAYETEAIRILDNGVIAGNYFTTSPDCLIVHGFLRHTDGTMITIDAPGGIRGTFASDVNEDGTVVGYYQDAGSIAHGYIRRSDGTFIDLDVGSCPPIADTINSSGVAAGSCVNSVTDIFSGFVRGLHGTIQIFDAPGVSEGIFVDSINVNSTVTGYYTTYQYPYTYYHGFERGMKGTFIAFDPPVGFSYIFPTRINSNDVIVGNYCDIQVTGACHGFLRMPDGDFITLDVPEAVHGTYPDSVNTGNIVVGYFQDERYREHGFVHRVGKSSTTFDVPGSIDTTPSDINSSGVITGGYADATGLSHGFILTP